MTDRTDDNYRLVLDDLTELISRIRPDGTISFANEVCCRFFGETRAQMLGRNWQPRAHPDDVPMVLERLALMSPENPVVVIENRLMNAAGEYRWMQFVNRGLFDAEGRLVETQAVGRDVTERRTMEEELRRHRRRILELDEDLRRSIARELHDDVGTNLAALGMHLALVDEGLSPESRVRLGARLGDCRRLLDEVSRSVRNLQADLRPPVLDDYGLQAALRWLAEQFAMRCRIDIDVRTDDDAPRLPHAAELALFRIVQETLSNVLKHAAATRIEIVLLQSTLGLSLTVTDDGRGFDPKARHAGVVTGWGLTTMRERAEAIGGRLEIIASKGHGTCVSVTLNQEA